MAISIVALAACGPLGGCGSYQMQGRVVTGPTPEVLVVAADDPRLQGPGVTGASLHLTLNPDSLGREPLAHGYSGGDGAFAIDIDKFGAGTLMLDVGLVARQRGHEPTYGAFVMPGKNKRVLVVMVRGQDRPLEVPNTLDRAREFLRDEDLRQPHSP